VVRKCWQSRHLLVGSRQHTIEKPRCSRRSGRRVGCLRKAAHFYMTETKQRGVLDYGGAGSTHATDEALANFPGAATQPLSMCCTPVELLSNDGFDTVIGRGSAFFWKHNGLPFLITNWHVVSGRNLFTGEQLSTRAFIPERIRFFGMTYKMDGLHVRFFRQAWVLTLDEQARELLDRPPQANTVDVDLWGLPIPQDCVLDRDPNRTGFRGSEYMSSFVNDHVVAEIATRAGDDCFVLGYPLGNYAGLMPPLWKRGSIASDTNIGVDNRPMFLVDGSTTSSMSGSPVFRRVSTGFSRDPHNNAVVENVNFAFLGVYAGRLQSAELAQTGIGYAWYGTLIGKVLDYYGYRADSLQRTGA
jgi:hypothetical protein